MNVLGQIAFNVLLAQGQARRPLAGYAIETLRQQPVVARFLKHCGKIQIARRVLQGCLSHRPEGKDKRLAGQAYPFLGEIVSDVARAIDLQVPDRQSPGRRRAVFSICSMSGDIAANVLPPPHHFANRTLVSATEVMDEVSSATRPNLFQRNFADQQDGANRPPRSDGYAGKNGKIGNAGVSRRWNDADIRRSVAQTGGTLRRAGCRKCRKSEASLSVLEIPHQGRSIKVGDGGNPKAFHRGNS